MTRALVVDGYNVIMAVPRYREIADRDDLDSARSALLRDVASYADGRAHATVVFDGAANAHSAGVPHELLGVTVVFSAHGVSADSVVESLVREARERGDAVEVVTSDAQTQWAVLGPAVTRRSSAEFADELRGDEREWREHAVKATGRVPVEERIAEDVRATLERWARGGE